MKESKYIRIEATDEIIDHKTVYEVINKRGDYVLGQIYYLSAWRQFVFAPVEDSEYNHSCLSTIMDWLKELNKK